MTFSHQKRSSLLWYDNVMWYTFLELIQHHNSWAEERVECDHTSYSLRYLLGDINLWVPSLKLCWLDIFQVLPGWTCVKASMFCSLSFVRIGFIDQYMDAYMEFDKPIHFPDIELQLISDLQVKTACFSLEILFWNHAHQECQTWM